MTYSGKQDLKYFLKNSNFKGRNVIDMIFTESLKIISTVRERINSDRHYVPRRSQRHFCGIPAKNA